MIIVISDISGRDRLKYLQLLSMKRYFGKWTSVVMRVGGSNEWGMWVEIITVRYARSQRGFLLYHQLLQLWERKLESAL